MKKEIFVLILCCAISNGLAAQKKAVPQKDPAPANVAALDTVRENFPDGSVSRVYMVQQGTDIREGVAISYHPNGKVAVEAPYKNGKLDGVFKSFYENGKPWQTIGYKDGIEDGISTDYFDNGRKKKREIYNAGVLDGMSEEYKNGENQWGVKKSVAAELRPKYTTVYQNIIKQLACLLPSEDEKAVAQELMEFIKG